MPFATVLPHVFQVALAPLLDYLRREPLAALAIMLGCLFLLFLSVLVLTIRVAQITGRQARLLRGTDGKDVQRMLIEHVATMESLAARVERASSSGEKNAASLQHCLQRVGIVRFDAFADLGGRQSFSIAILDSEENGFVLTGLSARHETRVYAKPLEAGACVGPVPLIPEEVAAVDSARAGGPGTGDVIPANQGEPLPGSAADKLTQAAVAAGLLPPRPVPLHSGDRFSAALRNGG